METPSSLTNILPAEQAPAGKGLSFDEGVVWEVIKCHSRQRPVKLATVAALTGLSRRAVCRAVHNLVIIHRRPIGSSSDRRAGGYYLVTDWETLQEATAELGSREVKLRERRAALASITREQLSQQEALW